MKPNSSRGPFVGSVLFTLLGAVAQSADKVLPSVAALGPATLLGGGLAIAGQLAGNVLASFLYDRFTARIPSPDDIAQNGQLRDLVARAIGGTIQSEITATPEHRVPLKRLAAAAEDYWPLLASTELSVPLHEFHPAGLSDRITRTFKSGETATTASLDDWLRFLKDASCSGKCEGIPPAVYDRAAAALRDRLPSYLTTYVVIDSEKNSEAYAKLVLRMLSELVQLAKENKEDIKKIRANQEGGGAAFLDQGPLLLAELSSQLGKIGCQIDSGFSDLSLRLDALLTAESVSVLQGGGRRAKKEAARVVANLSRQTSQTAQRLENQIREFVHWLNGVDSLDSRAQASKLHLLIQELGKNAQKAHILTRRIVASSAAVVVLGLSLLFLVKSHYLEQNAENRQLSIEQKIKILYDAKATESTDVLSTKNRVKGYFTLSKITGISEQEIELIVATGKRATDPVTLAMSHYIAGEGEAALEVTSRSINEREPAVRPALNTLAELHTIKGLALAEAGKSDHTLSELRQAWSSYGAIGDSEKEMDTKLLASAVLFKNPHPAGSYEPTNYGVAIKLIVETLGLSESDFGGAQALFPSPGCYPNGKEFETFGWLSKSKLDGKEQLMVVKFLYISSWNSYENTSADFTPFRPVKLDPVEPEKVSGTSVTDPPGYLYFSVDFLRRALPILEKVITRLIDSPYFGDTHPYLLVLYINSADVAFSLGDREKTHYYAEKFFSLSRRLESEKKLPSSLSYHCRESIRRLSKEGFTSRFFDVAEQTVHLYVSEGEDGSVSFNWKKTAWDDLVEGCMDKIQIEYRGDTARDWNSVEIVDLSARHEVPRHNPLGDKESVELDYRARFVVANKVGPWSPSVRATLRRRRISESAAPLIPLPLPTPVPALPRGPIRTAP